MDTDTPANGATVEKPKVVIYSTPTCHFCVLAKDFFNSNEIEYTDYNVAEDHAKGQEMVQMSGQMGVPQIVINGEVIVGFNEAKIRELLGL